METLILEKMLTGQIPTALCILIYIIIALMPFLSIYYKKIIQKTKAQIAQIDNDVQRDLINNAIDRIDKLVTTNVIRMQHTVVKGLKESTKDGKVDKDELRQVAVMVEKTVLSQASEEVKELAALQIKDLSDYIQAQIEVALATIKGQVIKK